MNVKSFAAFFVLLVFMELSFTVASFIGDANSNKRKTREENKIAGKRKGFMKWFVDPCSNGFIRPVFQPQNF